MIRRQLIISNKSLDFYLIFMYKQENGKVMEYSKYILYTAQSKSFLYILYIYFLSCFRSLLEPQIKDKFQLILLQILLLINMINPIVNHSKLEESSAHSEITTHKKIYNTCSIKSHDKTQIKKQIEFLQAKYQTYKKEMYHKKILSQLTSSDIQQMGNLMNIIAMKYSQEGENKLAEEWLRRTLKYCEISERVRIITYNNLACVYKQSNDLAMALLYIKKAQKEADQFCLYHQDNTQITRVVTDCSLNLCAILSAMGEHYKALRAARKALSMLQSSNDIPESYYSNLFPLIKYNQAVELQRLKKYEEAQSSYIEAQKRSADNGQLRQKIEKALEQLKVKKCKIKQSHSLAKYQKKIKLSISKFCPSSKPQEQGENFETLEQVKLNKLQEFSSVKAQRTILDKQRQNNYSTIQHQARSEIKINKFFQPKQQENDGEKKPIGINFNWKTKRNLHMLKNKNHSSHGIGRRCAVLEPLENYI